MQEIYLLRHARPCGDPGRSFTGRADPPLDAFGRQQACDIPRCYTGTVGLPVLASPLLRAWQTAEIAFPGVQVRREPLAVELSFGVLDGLGVEEASRLYPEALQCLRRTPLDARQIGGECWDDVVARATMLAKEFESGASVVLVSHQYFLAALVTLLVPAANSYQLALAHAGGIHLWRGSLGKPWFLDAEGGHEERP